MTDIKHRGNVAYTLPTYLTTERKDNEKDEKNHFIH